MPDTNENQHGNNPSRRHWRASKDSPAGYAEFPGKISGVQKYLAQVDVINPVAKMDVLGIPVSVKPAGAFSRLISKRSGGVPFTITFVNPYSCALASTIRRIVAEGNRLHDYSIRCREASKRFSKKAMVSSFLELYEHLPGGRSDGGPEQ